jgi:hypothetical protein
MSAGVAAIRVAAINGRRTARMGMNALAVDLRVAPSRVLRPFKTEGAGRLRNSGHLGD